MSYALIQLTRPRARKEYRCIWCPEAIAAGEVHVHEVSKYDGRLQDHRWHVECHAAAGTFFGESGEEEFEPHAGRRGTTEEA